MDIKIGYLPKKYIGEIRPAFIIEEAPKRKSFTEIIKIAEAFNKEVENSHYIARVILTKKDGYIHTQCLSYYSPITKQPFKLGGKHNVLGSNAFDCDYLIPLE
tara:strand:+ start:156 stop:464 length:309 start_codon:yes stop_codon:yes gene_type:complete